jgi:hypothetical protein
MSDSDRFAVAEERSALGIEQEWAKGELWVNLGDDGLREAAYRGG